MLRCQNAVVEKYTYASHSGAFYHFEMNSFKVIKG